MRNDIRRRVFSHGGLYRRGSCEKAGEQILSGFVFQEWERFEMADKLYDVIITGGGPAGLAAALYAARDRSKTLILERFMPG